MAVAHVVFESLKPALFRVLAWGDAKHHFKGASEGVVGDADGTRDGGEGQVFVRVGVDE